MCAEHVSLLGRFPTRYWYIFTLCLSATLLILTVSTDIKIGIERGKLMNFSVWTLILSCAVWIFNEVLRVFFYYYGEKAEMSIGKSLIQEPLTREQKFILFVRFLVDIIAFGIWAALLVLTLL